jgi:hypothetical protein
MSDYTRAVRQALRVKANGGTLFLVPPKDEGDGSRDERCVVTLVLDPSGSAQPRAPESPSLAIQPTAAAAVAASVRALLHHRDSPPLTGGSFLTDHEADVLRELNAARGRGLIEKEYVLDAATSAVLPAAERLFVSPLFEEPRMLALKTELNSVKSQLDDKNLRLWSRHTDSTNITEQIRFAVRREADPEMSVALIAALCCVCCVRSWQTRRAQVHERVDQDVRDAGVLRPGAAARARRRVQQLPPVRGAGSLRVRHQPLHPDARRQRHRLALAGHHAQPGARSAASRAVRW